MSLYQFIHVVTLLCTGNTSIEWRLKCIDTMMKCGDKHYKTNGIYTAYPPTVKSCFILDDHAKTKN